MRIKITIGKLIIFVELNESETAHMIWANLPMKAGVELWGDEVYFYITPRIPLEKNHFKKDVVAVGDVAYWPNGPCLCLFFGPTPISKPGEIKPASSVSVCGRIVGDPLALKGVKEGDPVKVERYA